MKILHVITSMRTGGAEKLVCDMLPLMRDQGHQVELAVFDGTPGHLLESVRQHGITVHIFGHGLKSIYNPQHINKLKSTIGGGQHCPFPQHIGPAVHRTRSSGRNHTRNHRAQHRQPPTPPTTAAASGYPALSPIQSHSLLQRSCGIISAQLSRAGIRRPHKRD